MAWYFERDPFAERFWQQWKNWVAPGVDTKYLDDQTGNNVRGSHGFAEARQAVDPAFARFKASLKSPAEGGDDALKDTISASRLAAGDKSGLLSLLDGGFGAEAQAQYKSKIASSYDSAANEELLSLMRARPGRAATEFASAPAQLPSLSNRGRV